MALTKMKQAMKIILTSVFLFGLLFTVNQCKLMEPEPMTPPGRLKVLLEFKNDRYDLQPGDSLFAQARDFKLFKDSCFADVYQNPKQFLAYNDSIVSFNMLQAAMKDSVIQVAYGSVAPLNYDSLLFQIAPGNQLRLSSQTFPISTDYHHLGVSGQYSTIVKIKHPIAIHKNKTTVIKIVFALDKNIFRYLDHFIYSATVDTFFISNE